MPERLFEHVLVPVASPEDAETTIIATLPYLESLNGKATMVNVIEKAGGAPDKAGVEQREEYAEETFERGRVVAAESSVDLDSTITYGTDVAETIIDTAHDLEVSAIVFTPRSGSRWVKLLTGDVALSLVSESDVPVLSLADSDD